MKTMKGNKRITKSMKRKLIKRILGRVFLFIAFEAVWVGMFIYGFMHATTLN
ncbi:MAG: hypothetical protein IJF92_00040 [Bacilli bacterium]|nr:hypothetical protein [Bacilli bacterium]MBQ3307621.1 hypothetical protein [Bacilli bacterium]MBQ3422991.1 hypothetical protein [Romboutsia sp.]